MKLDRGARKSIRSAVFIGVLTTSIFSGSWAHADPLEISTQSDLELIGVDATTLAGNYILLNDISVSSMESITNLGAGSFTGTFDGAGYTISNLTRPLFNELNGATITDLNLSGDVELLYSCGGGTCFQDEVGMVARTASNSTLENITLNGKVTGRDYVGGAFGWATGGSITNLDSSIDVVGEDRVGGILGRAIDVVIDDVTSEGDVDASGSDIGGLVGLFNGNSSELSDSYSTGDVDGYSNVGGVIGAVNHSILVDHVASTGHITAVEIVGGIVGSADMCDLWTGPECGGSLGTLSNISAYGSVTASDHGAGSLVGVLWSGYISGYRAVATVVDTDPNNDSDPIDGYDGPGIDRLLACDCTGYESPSYGAVLTGTVFNAATFVSAGDGSGGGDSGPAPRERTNREVRENKEVRTAEKIEKTLGFNYETSLPKSAPISFVETTEKIDIAKVKAVEIAPTANVKVSARAGEALQISLKSESKEPVELWVKSPDGSWLLAGVITFDKDGKAILPPLQFKSAGDFTLVLNKQSADSATGSAPLNQTGSLLVAVS